MSPRLEFALRAVDAAGKATLAYFQKSFDVDIKADASPQTIADREAERLLREAIASEYPGEAILGEEEGMSGSGDTRWVIDPIDGTKSFVCGVPLYATLLSFEEEGQPQVAVCGFPALDEVLFAERGNGCYWNAARAHVSERRTLDGAIISVASLASLHDKWLLEPIQQLSSRLMAVRGWSDAYGHALVATGRIDAMIDPVLKRWDVSAMSLIVEEAGGCFTSLDGRTGLHDEALSSNGCVHEELVRALGR